MSRVEKHERSKKKKKVWYSKNKGCLKYATTHTTRHIYKVTLFIILTKCFMYAARPHSRYVYLSLVSTTCWGNEASFHAVSPCGPPLASLLENAVVFLLAPSSDLIQYPPCRPLLPFIVAALSLLCSLSLSTERLTGQAGRKGESLNNAPLPRETSGPFRSNLTVSVSTDSWARRAPRVWRQVGVAQKMAAESWQKKTKANVFSLSHSPRLLLSVALCNYHIKSRFSKTEIIHAPTLMTACCM